MKRKEFIKKFAVGGSILFAAPAVLNSCSDDGDSSDDDNGNGGGNPGEIKIDLTDSAYDDLGSVGGYAYKNNIIIFRTSESGYGALSKLCTHSQCTVTYNHSNNELPCPCHGSTFTTNGSVTGGPANSNLKKYTVKKEGDILTIT